MKFIDKIKDNLKEVFGGKKDSGFTENTVDVIQSFQDADSTPNVINDLPENQEQYSDDILKAFAEESKTFGMGSNSQTKYDYLTDTDGAFRDKVIASINVKRVPESELAKSPENSMVEAKDYLAELKVILEKYNMSIMEFSNSKIKIADERNRTQFDLNRTGGVRFYVNINGPWVQEIVDFEARHNYSGNRKSIELSTDPELVSHAERKKYFVSCYKTLHDAGIDHKRIVILDKDFRYLMDELKPKIEPVKVDAQSTNNAKPVNSQAPPLTGGVKTITAQEALEHRTLWMLKICGGDLDYLNSKRPVFASEHNLEITFSKDGQHVTGSTVDKKHSATFLTATVEKGERYIEELKMTEEQRIERAIRNVVLASNGNLSTFEEQAKKASVEMSITDDSKNVVGKKVNEGSSHEVSLELSKINGGKTLSEMHKLEKNEQDDHTVREAVKRGYKP
ncbi:hypothetical protein C2U56_00455 [Pseudomonas fluorescens]|uniref:hypothetical protein n=1 Tax=Pseudomonas rhodesiae TaxID=76760 RepID=UPI000CD43625|nr:hypothetical protein [Pseudomonas rhodesiae]POH43471.1 hypothetical protein C2U56_00455 [Pseudomonas fluorescens]